jgi:transcriptional regulator with XRE-family HTH domain
MLAELQKMTPEESKEQRMALGSWLKSLREERGLSQRELAELLSLDYYTFISQLETGRGKIPEQRYVQWAEALGQDPQSFVQTLLKHYHPVTYKILFDGSAA